MDGEHVGSVDSDLNSLLGSYSILRRVDKCDLTGQSGVIFFFSNGNLINHWTGILTLCPICYAHLYGCLTLSVPSFPYI